MITRREIFGLGGGAAFAALASSACGKKVQQGIRGYAFVANSEGKAVAAVDLSAFAVARHISVDHEPTAVIAPPAHPSVFVLTPASGSLHSISVEQLKFQRSLRLGQLALKMLLSPEGDAIYALLRSPKKLVRVRLDSFSVDWELPLPAAGPDPVDFDLSPYLGLAALSFSNGTVALVDLTAKQLRKSLPVETEWGAVRFQSDGKALILADKTNRSLHIFDSRMEKRVTELPLAVRPDNLCFSSDGGQLFVTGEGADAVCVVYHYHTPHVAETVLAGRGPAAMAASASPGYLFVANPASGDVSVLSIRDRKMIAVVGVGAEPGYITVTPNSMFALVLNRKSGDMAVLRVGGIQRNRQKSAGLFTMIPVGSTPVSVATRLV